MERADCRDESPHRRTGPILKADATNWLLTITALTALGGVWAAEPRDATGEAQDIVSAADGLPVREIDVSTETPADTADTESPSKTDAHETKIDAIEAAFKQFTRLRNEDRNDEAVTAALRVADLTQSRYGDDSLELAGPLINLALMQSQTGRLPDAEQNYRAAIAIIEQHEGALSSRLINPLSGLGHTYNRAGMYDQAIESFERALRLNNIELGFTNFEQFPIQDGLTTGYAGLHEYDDANFFQEAQLEIYQRKFGSDDPKIVPGLYKLAEWYGRIGNLEDSILTYRGADRILREHDGDDSVRRSEPLLGLARLFERQGNRPAAVSSLRKALKLIEESEEPDKLRQAELLVALGDLYTREARHRSAGVEYAAAWAELSGDDAHLDMRDHYFELPVRLAGGPFATVAHNARGKTADELEDGFVMISYAVDASGRARDVTVIESEPPGIMDKSLMTTYRRSYYRPRFADGVPVATENLLARHEFRYAPKRDNRADKDESPPPAPERGRLERPDGPGEN